MVLIQQAWGHVWHAAHETFARSHEAIMHDTGQTLAGMAVISLACYVLYVAADAAR